jgi:hypothetical protein
MEGIFRVEFIVDFIFRSGGPMDMTIAPIKTSRVPGTN